MVLGMREPEHKPGEGADHSDWRVKCVECSLRRLIFDFRGRRYQSSTQFIFFLSLGVGLVGGIYGIGGGAIMAPILVSHVGLPVHTIAGATLMGTFLTSVVGVTFSQAVAPLYRGRGTEAER